MEAARRAEELLAGNLASSAILIDFDGTLAPVVSRPADAAPLAGTSEVLAELCARAGRVALISGRPVEALRERILVEGLSYAGLYGLERAEGSGPVRRAPAALEWEEAIQKVTDEAAAWASRPEGAGIEVEPKGLAVTFHFRNAPDPYRAERIAELWAEERARETGLRLVWGKANVELVAPVGADKGSAALELVGELGRAVYMGDDLGDLAAFLALREWPGASLCVAVGGDETPRDVIVSADVVVSGPAEVLDLLRTIAECC